MILRSGYLTQINNSSGETVGYAYADPNDTTKSYWALPPVEDRPPDAGVTFVLVPATAGQTYAQFVATVRNNWNSNMRFLECTETSYTSYSSIPAADRARFFPNANADAKDGGYMPMEIDTGTTGLYMTRESATVNVGVAYRESSVGSNYDEYWVLGPSYSSTNSNALSGGTIDPGFNSFQSGMTCVKVTAVESATEPSV